MTGLSFILLIIVMARKIVKHQKAQALLKICFGIGVLYWILGIASVFALERIEIIEQAQGLAVFELTCKLITGGLTLQAFQTLDSGSQGRGWLGTITFVTFFDVFVLVLENILLRWGLV